MTLERPLRVLIVLTCSAGLALQCRVSGEVFATRGLGTAAMLWKLASYFTILTNFLLVLVQGTALAAPRSRLGRLAKSPATQAALLLYIMVVKIIYITVLARMWNPEGLQWWADLLLHHVPPVFQICLWIAYCAHERLPWKLAWQWLAWPALYLVWVLLRGGDYPYPFLDVDRLGYGGVAMYSLLMGAVFLAGGLLIIGGTRYFTRRLPRQADAGR